MKYRKSMVRLPIIVLLLIIGTAFSLKAQSGLQMSVYGMVRDANTNLPLHGVGITIYKLEQEEITKVLHAKSNSKGFYEISLVEAGEYRCGPNLCQQGLRKRIIELIEVIAERMKNTEPNAHKVSNQCRTSCKKYHGEN